MANNSALERGPWIYNVTNGVYGRYWVCRIPEWIGRILDWRHMRKFGFKPGFKP